jgi:hypothetical protein
MRFYAVKAKKEGENQIIRGTKSHDHQIKETFIHVADGGPGD